MFWPSFFCPSIKDDTLMPSFEFAFSFSSCSESMGATSSPSSGVPSSDSFSKFINRVLSDISSPRTKSGSIRFPPACKKSWSCAIPTRVDRNSISSCFEVFGPFKDPDTCPLIPVSPAQFIKKELLVSCRIKKSVCILLFL